VIINTLRDRLNRERFELFIIRSSSGKGILVASPELGC
jgi:hypothetical protein